MARFDLPRTQPIYDAAARFLTECLRESRTLFDDNAAVWTLENLQTIKRVCVDAPDEGARTFIEKFHDQIQPAGPAICRLAAELLIVYFLFPSNVGDDRKRQVVKKVLSWGGDNLPEPNLLSSAFVNGIGSGGHGYNIRRPLEIAFLIECAIAWKNLPQDQQVTKADDPKLFQEFVDSIEDAESKQLRHMLLHLLFPEHFERIASGNHKRRPLQTAGG